MARADGQLLVKVLDFGISKVDAWNGAAALDLSVTHKSIALGCPPYISPEQWRSAKDVDGKTDIWALGVILYELLTGRVPFEGDSPAQIAVKVATEPPPSLRASRPDVPAGLEQIILKCLAKDSNDRFRDAAELSGALRAYDGKPATAAGSAASSHARAAGSSAAPFAISRATVDARDARRLLGQWWREPTGARFVQIAAAVGVMVALIWVGTHRHGPAPAVLSSLPAKSLATDLAPHGEADGPSPPSMAASPAEDDVPGRAESSASLLAAIKEVPAPVPSPQPKVSGSVRVRAPQAKGSAEASRGAAAGHCDPPYFFDARGNRVFKVDCL